jgi:hypothetical protein
VCKGSRNGYASNIRGLLVYWDGIVNRTANAMLTQMLTQRIALFGSNDKLMIHMFNVITRCGQPDFGLCKQFSIPPRV